MNFDQLKQDSIGKWPGILQRLGIDVGNGKHCPCPSCGGKDRFRFDDKEGRGTWICNQCGAGDGVSLTIKVLGIEYKEAMEAIGKIVGTVDPSKHQTEKPTSPDMLRTLFKESRKVRASDAVQKYLQKRGLTTMPKTLRYGTKVWEAETKKDQRAMLAIFQLPDGEAVTIHRTYIDGEGNKLNVEKPKKLMPTLKKMTGGAVRLYTYVQGVLGVCEGLETAIAIHESYNMPVWPCLSSTLLEGFIPPSEVTHICIFADNDRNFTGQKAAYILANRLAIEKKMIASVEIPELEGEDFLDMINRTKQPQAA